MGTGQTPASLLLGRDCHSIPKEWLGVGEEIQTNLGRPKLRRKTILSPNLASALCHRKL